MIDKTTTYKLITDYKDRSGRDMHQCFSVWGVPHDCSKEEKRKILTAHIARELIKRGDMPTRILLADCELTLDELQDFTDGKLPLNRAGVISLEVLWSADTDVRVNLF